MAVRRRCSRALSTGSSFERALSSGVWPSVGVSALLRIWRRQLGLFFSACQPPIIASLCSTSLNKYCGFVDLQLWRGIVRWARSTSTTREFLIAPKNHTINPLVGDLISCPSRIRLCRHFGVKPTGSLWNSWLTLTSRRRSKIWNSISFG